MFKSTLGGDMLILRRGYVKGDLPGTPKDMGPPFGKRDPYHSQYSHIFRVPGNPIE